MSAIETPEQIAERFVAAFMGDHESATVYRDRLVVMVKNAVTQERLYNQECACTGRDLSGTTHLTGRCRRLPVTGAMVMASAAALDIHRWKSISAASVECECGEILTLDPVNTGDAIEDLALMAFPADTAFRRHMALAALRAAEDARWAS